MSYIARRSYFPQKNKIFGLFDDRIVIGNKVVDKSFAQLDPVDPRNLDYFYKNDKNNWIPIIFDVGNVSHSREIDTTDKFYYKDYVRYVGNLITLLYQSTQYLYLKSATPYLLSNMRTWKVEQNYNGDKISKGDLLYITQQSSTRYLYLYKIDNETGKPQFLTYIDAIKDNGVILGFGILPDTNNYIRILVRYLRCNEYSRLRAYYINKDTLKENTSLRVNYHKTTTYVENDISQYYNHYPSIMIMDKNKQFVYIGDKRMQNEGASRKTFEYSFIISTDPNETSYLFETHYNSQTNAQSHQPVSRSHFQEVDNDKQILFLHQPHSMQYNKIIKIDNSGASPNISSIDLNLSESEQAYDRANYAFIINKKDGNTFYIAHFHPDRRSAKFNQLVIYKYEYSSDSFTHLKTIKNLIPIQEYDDFVNCIWSRDGQKMLIASKFKIYPFRWNTASEDFANLTPINLKTLRLMMLDSDTTNYGTVFIEALPSDIDLSQYSADEHVTEFFQLEFGEEYKDLDFKFEVNGIEYNEFNIELLLPEQDENGNYIEKEIKIKVKVKSRDNTNGDRDFVQGEQVRLNIEGATYNENGYYFVDHDSGNYEQKTITTTGNSTWDEIIFKYRDPVDYVTITGEIL